MKKRAIIFAAGPKNYWKEQDMFRQLVEVEGKPLLTRTIDQLIENGVDDIVVITGTTAIVSALERYGAERPSWENVKWHAPVDESWQYRTVMTSHPFWPVETHMIGILGDVFFTDDAMKELCSLEGLHFFGRRYQSRLTAGPGEPFAFTWQTNDLQFTRACEYMHEWVENKPDLKWWHTLVWGIYRTLAGVALNQHFFEFNGVWVERNDFTDDFDSYEKYLTWKTAYSRRFIYGHKQEPVKSRLEVL